MMKKLIIILCIFLIGCGKVPISKLKLDEVLIKPGDLPAGFSGAQIRNTIPEDNFLELLERFPISEEDYVIYQELERKEENSGFIIVVVYQNKDKLIEYSNSQIKDHYLTELAWHQQRDYDQSTLEYIENIGEKALLDSFYSSIRNKEYASEVLVFYRCNGFVAIDFEGIYDNDSVIAYSQKLDKRLMEYICR